jgi:YqfQ-like protein
MFPQRPMPPMNSRGFFPQQGQFPMGRQPFQGPVRGPNLGGRQFGAQMPVRGGGGLKGLLSRIIPGSQGAGGAAINPQGIIQGATGASRATGALQGLANPANISGMLGNVQKVLGVAQQVTPMVQQYGPLVKNLPAMIQIYRELKNGDSGDEATASDESVETSTEGTTEEPATKGTQDTPKLKKQEQTNESVHIESETETNSNVGKKHSSRPKRSGPRMYI